MLARLRHDVGSSKKWLKFQLMRWVDVNVLDSYTGEAPSAQLALDIFKGEFVSRFPAATGLTGGDANLFEDGRIEWLHSKVDLNGRTVLELGPFEGGHSFMMQRLGVEKVVGIESNSRAFLKSLVVKEVLGLNRVEFRYGNFLPYLRDDPQSYDVCVASGVLYHMTNPIELLALLTRVTDTLFLWTHYYDAQLVERHAHVKERLETAGQVAHDGLSFPVYKYRYGARDLSSRTFCGGGNEFSYWMSRDAILACLDHYGFGDVEIGFDHPDHQNGPSFAILARRSAR